jgi:streptogramin lyase
MGGVTPVSGSSVKLWEAGTTGYGTGATQLGSTATSAADGSFTLAISSCPSAGAELYLTAHSGNAGGGINSSLMMMAALGPCGSINFSTPVVINEVTTAGSVYALSQFLSTTSSGTVGASATNATGLFHAFANAANLMSVASGSALSTTPGGAGTAPQDNLNSIANALGACVQTSGSASANCTELFDCALPGAAFSAGACTGGTGSVADTLAAALSIARNPADVSVAGVNDVATKAALFSPALASAPKDWSMPLNFAPSGSNFNEPFGVAIDSSGHVWAANLNGNTVTALNNNGTLFGNFAPTGSNFNIPIGVAIDSSGRVWVTNNGGGPTGLGTVTALNNDGSFDLNNSSDFDGPGGVAIDGSGHVWVANAAGGPGGTGYVTALFGDGTLDGNFFPTGSDFDGPAYVAIASTGVVWVTNELGGTITALHNNGTLIGNFHSTLAPLNAPEGIAIDSSGDLWVTNTGGDYVTEVSVAGFIFHNFALTGSFNGAFGVAIDSSGRVWVTNFDGNNVTALNNDGTLFGNFAPPGSNFFGPGGVAIDSSGNLWVPNGGDNTVTELVGVAAPVLTPMVACLTQTTPATVCLP